MVRRHRRRDAAAYRRRHEPQRDRRPSDERPARRKRRPAGHYAPLTRAARFRLRARRRGCSLRPYIPATRAVMKPLDELKARLLEVDDLKASASLLRWDQMTYMPPRGGSARGRQAATLSRLAHERFTESAIGRLLD